MNRHLIVAAAFLCTLTSKAQILPVSLVVQQQDQWCWAGCSKCVLNYYGYAVNQCDIAEYTREVATWHSYGTTNCCTNATLGCNYWNYNWSYAGSIQDILQHFDNIITTGTGVLTTTQIASMLGANHLFIEHWSWPTGGGHFVVGYGISGTGSSAAIYYMNPWPGEGMSFGTYSWMVTGTNDMGDHTWDATNQVTSYTHTAGITPVSQMPEDALVYPNPSTGAVWINGRVNDDLAVSSATGAIVYNATLKSARTEINLAGLPAGMYVIKIKSLDGNKFAKLVLQ